MFNELESIRNRLLAYIESAYHLSDPQLVQLRRELLEQPEVLCHAPFIESSARYTSGKPYSELDIPSSAEQLLSFLATDAGGNVVFPIPYEHQAQALEAILGNELQHTIVTTGTGSGKTETFLLPILGRLAREAGQSTNAFGTRAVRALLLYPMNALVNDQLSRLRLLFGATATRDWFTRHGGRPVKFGRYTSRTPFPGLVPDDTKRISQKLAGLRFYVDMERRGLSGNDAKAAELLGAMREMGKWPAKDEGANPGVAKWLGSGGAWKDANGKLRRAVENPDDTELLTRHEIQANAPDLLVTNYSMLEYMMLRPIERSIFQQTRDYFVANRDERFILVLDEAHLYRGAQGTEVAMLIRRLRHRLELLPEQFQVITTSASFEDGYQARKFAAGLTGTDSARFQWLQGEKEAKLPSGGGEVDFADILAQVSLSGLLSDDSKKRFQAITPLLQSSSRPIEPATYTIESDGSESGKARCKVVVIGLTVDGEFDEESIQVSNGGSKVTERRYLTIVELKSSDPAVAISAKRDNGYVECIAERDENLTPSEKAAHFGLSRILFDVFVDKPVVGRLINLTSSTSCSEDSETENKLGAQEIRAMAARLFPNCSADKAQAATDVLVEAASMARSKPGDTPLLAARVHRFFRGIPGIWACSDPNCSELPVEMQGVSITGKLYVQPRRECECGSRAFELLACRNCGTAMLQAYATSARRPDYLWSEDVGEVDDAFDAVVPLHLCLDDPEDHVSDDDEIRSREYILETVTGRLFKQADESSTNRAVYIPPEAAAGNRKAGMFDTCPKCRDRYSGISNMATKGDEPFQHLVSAQLMSQPPMPGNDTALQGRKLLVFSDGRQPASRLAGKLKSNSLRDAVRPLFINGLRYVANRWFDGKTQLVAIEHAYLALLCGAIDQDVELRPQLKETEQQSYYSDQALAQQLYRSKTAKRKDFEETSSQIAERTPADILISLYEVLFNPLSGIHSLALGCLTPVISSYLQEAIEQLPAPQKPESIESDPARKQSLLEFWLIRMARERAVRLPGTPGEWVGNKESGIRLGANHGRFEKLMKPRVGNSFYKEQLAGGQKGGGPWSRFFEERLGTSVRADGFLVDPKRVSVDLDFDDWVRCEVCTFAIPNHPFYLGDCPECRSVGSLRALFRQNKDVDEVFMTRKGFYRKDVDDETKDLRPFVAEEHTAAIGAIDAQDAFSRAEWHEMRFQDLDVLGPGDEPGGIVDVLSCTTTMEVGIDIGSLTAVSLRNVPPNRSNYQQRAGRAGRRGSSLSTVITYADQGTHDQRYFKRPAEMISGPVTDPVLNLENSEIVRRHGYALILSMFQRERIGDAQQTAASNIFSSLGLVEDFRTGNEDAFSFRGLQSWLQSNQAEIETAIRSIVPNEYLESTEAEDISTIPSLLLQRLAEIGCDYKAPSQEQTPEERNEAVFNWFEDDDFGDDAPDASINATTNSGTNTDTSESPDTPRQTLNLLDRLFETASLPSYAFPTDVVSMTVFDRNRSGAYRSVTKYAPQRGLDQALSSYAPGREVFIDGKRHYSFALYSPMRSERQKSWEQRKLYFECDRCGYAKLEDPDGEYREREVLDCPSCNQPAGMGPAIYWMEPPGFAHPVDMDEELAVDQPPDYTRPTQAKLDASFKEGDAFGNTTMFGERGFTLWTKKEELFLTNRGSEDLKNRGFVYCLRCGRIEPKGWHDQARSYLNNRMNHPKPYPNHRDQPNCPGFTQIVSLGTKFVSDISLFRFHMGGDVLLPPGSALAKISLTTVAQSLAICASDKLEIDRANIGAEYRAAQTEKGRSGAEVDVYLYDTTPGGAGFVKAAVAEPVKLIRQAIALLDGCDCESSCYKCLRSYGNRFLHHILDREVGASLLKHVLAVQQKPVLDKDAESKLLKTIAVDLRDMNQEVAQQEGYLVVPSLGDRRIVLSHSLMDQIPATPEAESAYALGKNNSVPIPHLMVKRALPSATQLCITSIGEQKASRELPTGLRESTSGVVLHRFRTLGESNSEGVATTDLSLTGIASENVFLLEIDGPQLEKLKLNLDGAEIPVVSGTVFAFETINEPANLDMHNGKLRLVRSSASAFKATKTNVTLAMCKWSEFDGRVSVRLQYQSASARATPQKVAPESLSMIGKPIGIVRRGTLCPIKFP